MTRVLAVAVSVLMVAALGFSGAMAQQPKTDKPMEKPAADKTGQMVEGKIKSVDKAGVVTLEDGTKLSIPKTVSVPKEQLKPGAMISAEYKEEGGRKVATSVQIKG